MSRECALSACALLFLPILLYSQTIHIDAIAGHDVNRFRPSSALGAGVDRLPFGATDKLLSPTVLKLVLEAGWQSVTYRQNTELHVEAWHWNPHGTWSDPAGNKGYFTGDATPSEMIRHSYGYPLPHRGFTRNGGTEREGYSRLTDGNTGTYWKSNPYLTKTFTGEDDRLHPQWVIVDLASKQDVNAIRIAWGEPYARKYNVQFWTGGDDPISKATTGIWQSFPGGSISNGTGGDVTIPLSRSMLLARFIRILMTESSNTCDDHGSTDRRDCVGYAIRELYAGSSDGKGEFHDAVRHEAGPEQTVTYCSSVDPWHSASDLNEKGGDQAGFDLFYTSGVTRGLPAIVPVAMLYGTPEDSAAEISYLEKRKYPISYIEMGEEPDGQFMLPEDYGALYLQWATALHKVDPSLKLGGPVFQGVNEDIQVWPDSQGRVSWLGRFLDYLKAHNRLADLAFFSFEHYPFEPCDTKWSNLYEEPKLMTHILQVWREDGLPPNVPMFDTETNISWNLNQKFADIFGGLWVADSIGSFLTGGGSATYFFHYLPLPLESGCNGWGTFSMQTATPDYSVKNATAQFFASQMISKEWVQPGNGVHTVFRASSDVTDSAGNALVTTYALFRPDGKWSLLIVNRDQYNSQSVKVAFRRSEKGRAEGFSGPVQEVTFGSDQYDWHPDGPNGYPDPAGPLVESTVEANAETVYELPKASISVLTGKLEH
jgi:hypothetical protein